MKLFKNLFLTLTLTSILVSCSSDDVHIPTNSEKIIGEWELNEFKLNGNSITTVGSEDPIEAIIMSNGETFTNTLSKFTHPNTLKNSGSFLLVTTTTIGEEVIEKQAITQFDTSGTWKIEGEKLTIKADGENTEYDILSLTEKVLKLKGVDEDTTTIGSTVIVTKLTSTLSFEKK